MCPPDSSPLESDSELRSPFVETRYPLPALLREVQLDRASVAFAMEKLDQPTINLLFERQRLHRDSHPGQ